MPTFTDSIWSHVLWPPGSGKAGRHIFGWLSTRENIPKNTFHSVFLCFRQILPLWKMWTSEKRQHPCCRQRGLLTISAWTFSGGSGCCDCVERSSGGCPDVSLALSLSIVGYQPSVAYLFVQNEGAAFLRRSQSGLYVLYAKTARWYLLVRRKAWVKQIIKVIRPSSQTPVWCKQPNSGKTENLRPEVSQAQRRKPENETGNRNTPFKCKWPST